MKKKLEILKAIILFLIVAETIMKKDMIIVKIGIQRYRMLRIAVCAALSIYIIFSMVIPFILDAREEKKKKIQEKEASSEKNGLNSIQLQQAMHKNLEKKWACLSDQCSPCITQMEKMSSFRKKLNTLFKENNNTSFPDAEEMLADAEQGMCRNFHKLLNYMSIADPDTKEDIDFIGQQISMTCRKNADILKNTQEFVFTMAEYLSGQGDGENHIKLLNEYTEALLKAIRRR